AFAMGIVAGLRAMTVPAAVSWGAHLGILRVAGTWLSWLAYPWLPWVLSALAVAELITDQLPKTPSRTVPVQFGTRIVTGALGGAAIGAAGIPAAVAGAAGAVIGTLCGRAFRAKLAAAFHRDPPAAFIEDAIAIGAAILILVVRS